MEEVKPEDVGALTYIQTEIDSLALYAKPVGVNDSVKADDILTASRMALWNDCRRKHRYRYIDEYAKKDESIELTFGTLWHKFMEYWWADRYADGFRLVSERAKDCMDSTHFAYIKAMMQGYDAAHREERGKYKVIAIEKEWRAPLLDVRAIATPGTPQEVSGAFILAGKIDLVLEEGGEPNQLVGEHKTTNQQIESDADSYWLKLAFDHQLSMYVIGCDASGYDVTRCLYDVARKPELRQSQVPLTDKDGTKIVLAKDGTRIKGVPERFRYPRVRVAGRSGPA